MSKTQSNDRNSSVEPYRHEPTSEDGWDEEEEDEDDFIQP